MSNRVLTEEAKRLVAGSISATKTTARHIAKGYRCEGQGEVASPRGSVKVEPVGKYWGVFDYAPRPGIAYITIEEGIEEGKRRCR